jgi:hypothetical protein
LECAIRGATQDLNRLNEINVECLRVLLHTQSKYRSAMRDLIGFINSQPGAHESEVQIMLFALKSFDKLFTNIRETMRTL